MWPDVSVVIPYYNDASRLAEVLTAVRAQDYSGVVEIIIADDGSATAVHDEPVLDGLLDGVIVVWQADLGFRAAAARNLGAAAATGDVLAFLDADTVPLPDYLTAVVPHMQRTRRAVVVGTRLTGEMLTEPQWLVDAWEATSHLSNSTSTSWRYIISAALTCSTQFFRHIGGFDGNFVGYGGEDWEFGWRAWNAGAQFVHEPSAIAHHPKEDFGLRHADKREEARVKNIESLALARRITHPIARPTGVIFDRADVAVTLPLLSEPGATEAVIASWLAIDARVYISGEVPALFREDPRVVSRTPDSEGATNSAPAGERIRVDLTQPWALENPDAFYRQATDQYLCIEGGTEVVSARALALTAPRFHTSGASLGLRLVAGPQRLERLFAGW